MTNEKLKPTLVIGPGEALPANPDIVSVLENGSQIIVYPSKFTPIYDPALGTGANGYGKIVGWERRPTEDFR